MCVNDHICSLFTGVWDRYDGVAYFPGVFTKKQGFFSRVRTVIGWDKFGDRVREDAVTAAQIFLPTVKEIQIAGSSVVSSEQPTLESYMEKIGRVMSSLKLQMVSRNLFDMDESLAVKVSLYS
jgi:hypothetical protein